MYLDSETALLRVNFDDASQQCVDLEPVMRGELYGTLRDLTLSNRCQIVVKFDNIQRTVCLAALTIAAKGGKADSVMPL